MQSRKSENCDYISRNVDLKTDKEMAEDLGLSPERIRQYRVAYGIERRIRTLTDAFAEIRKLRGVCST